MLISHLPRNDSCQNFGFSVKVKEDSKLVDMADSYLFRTVPREAIDAFERKAADIFPQRTVHIEYSIWKPVPHECFEVELFTDGSLKDKALGHNASGLLNYLKKATNKYHGLHSRLFYDGKKSPETLTKIERFKNTIYRPFSNR